MKPHIKNVFKLAMATALSLAMIVTSGEFAFAAETYNPEQTEAEYIANDVEDITGTDDVIKEVCENDNAFEVDGAVDVEIPKSSDGEVVIEAGQDTLGMTLPEIIDDEDAVLTDKGTIVYGTDEDEVNLAVQTVEKENYNIGVRTLVTINEASAPHEYEFEYNLEEGQKLMLAKDYADEFYEADSQEMQELKYPNDYYIVDENDEIIGNIEEPWAKDANGEKVATNYELDGNTIIQVVNFDENTAFPVVADPYHYNSRGGKPADSVVGSGTKTISLSHAAYGLCIWSIEGIKKAKGKAITKAASAVLKESAKKAIASVLGGVSWVTWGVSGYCTIMGSIGYNYTNIKINYVKKRHYVYRRGWTATYLYTISGIPKIYLS
ncbi:MAG: hypothetical protein HUJ63_12725 [Enterococcus sp.]|nr:hypothetical protein [Enterococcus sp.]